MPELTAAEAVKRTRWLLMLPESAEETAYRVRRLDQPGSAYFLVRVADHIACVDAHTGELESLVGGVLQRQPDSPHALVVRKGTFGAYHARTVAASVS